MKLTVRIIQTPASAGDTHSIALCDEDGQMLPMQISCAVTSEVGEASHVTASFIVDGDQVRFA